MNWNDPEARARLLEQVGPHEFVRQWNRHTTLAMQTMTRDLRKAIESLKEYKESQP